MKLEVNNLFFSYGSHEVVKNVSFKARSSEVVAILGVNGVGKSTMLKCINNINIPSSGEVVVNGKSVKELDNTDLAKHIGYVAQNCEFADGTVFDSVLLGRKPFIKWDVTSDDLKIVQNTLKLLSLEEYAMRNVLELSGGERQKVAIARVLAQQTPVLLFDEPTSNLDLKNQLEVLSMIRKIVKEKKLSAIITIHDLNLALRFADRFLVMNDGKVYDFGDQDIVNEQSILDVYGVSASLLHHNGQKVVVPK